MKNDKMIPQKVLYGIREGNKSYKLLKQNENEYILIEKYYMFHLFKFKKTLKFNIKEDAQDYIIQSTKNLNNLNF